MGEGLGWGWLLNLGRDAIGRGVRVPKRVSIANAKNPIALRVEPRVSLSIVQLGLRQVVTPAIDLDHQLRAVMDEIDDVAAHRRLASDVEVELAKRFPQDALACGHFPAQASGALDGAVGVERLFWFA
ncbi:MAG: hypothetical protein WAL33_18355 [Caulobacter sp.]